MVPQAPFIASQTLLNPCCRNIKAGEKLFRFALPLERNSGADMNSDMGVKTSLVALKHHMGIDCRRKILAYG
jgi:hypothetical protein